MPRTEYEVAAELRMAGTRQAAQGLQGLANRLTTVGQRISSTRTGLGGMARQIAGMAAAYVGFRAVTAGLGGMVRTAVSFNRELETTRIGLQSVLAATSGGMLTFEQAGAGATQVFNELRDDAIASTATTSELFGIYQSILGPIRAAGFALSDVREITNSTVAASSALGVDFQQASRDISQMVRGAAGMDVRLFSMLRSTGAIAQSTEEWNRNMTTPQRVEALRTALSQFAPAAEAYGRTWAGLTSSIRDLYEQFLAAIAGPVIARMERVMGRMVDMIVANRDAIERVLGDAGDRMATVLGRVFDRLKVGFDAVVSHWDQIIARIREVVGQVREMIPRLMQTAKVFAGVEIARMAAGPGLRAAGGVAELAGGLGGILGGGAAGSAAAGGAGSAAAGGGAAAAGAALGPILAILAAVLAVVGSVVMVVVDLWDDLVVAFDFARPLLEGLWGDLQALGLALWEVVRPLLRLIGGGWLLALGALFAALVVVLRLVVGALRVAIGLLAMVMNLFEEYVVDPIIEGIGAIAVAVGDFLGWVETLSGTYSAREIPGGVASASTSDVEDPLAYLEQRYGRGTGPRFGEVSPLAGGAGLQQPIVHNDFRGSRIQVRQEYRQADPDRIAIQMIEDIQRQAESRVQSGYIPALTR